MSAEGVLTHPPLFPKGVDKMTQAERQKQYANLIGLGLHPDEVAEVLADDERIDRGEKMFELPKELEEGAKKARHSGNCKGYTKPKERTRPIDTEKRQIINLIAETVENITDEGTAYINNAEREIEFVKNGRKFKIVLSCPRS